MMLHFCFFKCLREKQFMDYLKCTGNISSNILPDEETYVDMLNGKQNLSFAESYERCKKTKFCCFGDNMDVYILSLRLAALFLMNLASSPPLLPLQNASQIVVFVPSFIICNCAGNHLSKNCSCWFCYKSNTVCCLFFSAWSPELCGAVLLL